MRVAIYARVSTANNGQDPERVHRAPRLSVGQRVRGRGNQRIRRRSPRALDGSKTPDWFEPNQPRRHKDLQTRRRWGFWASCGAPSVLFSC